jgi:hypothetical protein
MRNAVLLAVMIGNLPIAAQCPDPLYRDLEIGGDTISGYVSIARKRLPSASVELYSWGRLWRTTHTDKDGQFAISDVSPGKYTLSVTGWGSTTIRIDPEFDRPFLPRTTPLTHLLSVSGSGEFPALVAAPNRDNGTLGQHPAWWITLSDRGCASAGATIG